MHNHLLKSVKLSHAAYNFATHSAGGTQIFITENDHATWFAFRGTETKSIKDFIEDVSTDVQFTKIDSHLGVMHTGFHDAFELAAPYVREKALAAQRAGKKIYLTGHSLGGGLALVAFVWLQSLAVEVEHSYVFGCPRVFGKETAEEFNEKWKEKVTRVVNNNDIVTRIPTRLMGYSHVGRLYYFTEDGEVVLDGDLTWWARFWDRCDGILSDFGELGLDAIKDHAVSEYGRLIVNQTESS